MSLILNIDTATENAQVSLAKDGEVMHSLSNTLQKDHASFLQTAVQQLINTAGISLQNIDAVAVAAGPGSYTGLRVGMASAKGLCYALNKPLITLNTLQIITVAALQQTDFTPGTLFCPMIDARRMEVFTAIYDAQLTALLAPCAMVLNENSYADYLKENKIAFAGNGAAKWSAVTKNANAFFPAIKYSAKEMSTLADRCFKRQLFADLAYSEPFYIKEFQDKI